MIDVVEMARRFVDTPSVTGTEAAMAEASAGVLRELGYDVELLPVAPGRPNVLARLDPPRVLLCTHLDTVPPHIPAREDAEWLHGRGACDAKGILAAMLAAAAGLVREGVRDVGFLLSVDEEGDSLGAKHANATLDLPSVRYTIVGEPTDSRFARAQKGGFKFSLRVRGQAAHSGYPERGGSAVLALLPLLGAIAAGDWGEDGELGRGSANIGIIHGGRAANIIPDSAEAEVYVRVVDSAAAVRERVQQIVGRSTLPAEWVELTASDPQRLMTIPGEPETVVAFNTDVPHMGRFGRKLLVGPGSILVAHGAEERIAKSELRAAVEQYRRAVLHLRGL
jgi:acetylornithine deacetylase